MEKEETFSSHKGVDRGSKRSDLIFVCEGKTFIEPGFPSSHKG